jgi:hypothetical protein
MSTDALTECRVKSYELLKKAIVEKGFVKQVPQNGRPGQSTVYQWARPPRSASGTGSRNPLDLVERLIQVADIEGKIEIANWVCFAAGGFFILAPSTEERNTSEFLKHYSQLIQEYSTMVQTLAKTAEDGIIEPHEAKQIREAWKKIQSTTECYVQLCEHGEFDLKEKERTRQDAKIQVLPSSASAG